MSQQQPEPIDPTPEQTNGTGDVSEQPTAQIPFQDQPGIPNTPSLRLPRLSRPSLPRVNMPSLPPLGNWMQQGQEITAKILSNQGTWVFGSLIVADLLLLVADLLLAGSGDRAILISGLALALALPFTLAGLGILRYFGNLTRASASLASGKLAIVNSSLSYALYLSAFFTVFAYSAALWRVYWIVTLLFLLAGVGALVLLVRAVRAR